MSASTKPFMAMQPRRRCGRARSIPGTTTAALSGGRRGCELEKAVYFFGIIDPVCRYRVWKLKASSNMCGEWRPALGRFMARFT